MLICRDNITTRLYHALFIVEENTEPPEKPLSLLSLFPDKYVMLVGDGLEFTVTAKDTAGHDLANFVPKLTSSNAAIVSIDPLGRVTAIAEGTATVTANSGGQSAQATIYVGATTYDVASLGAPKVLDANYIDLSKIERISRFRSTVGHSYVDGSGETCRSMKHYYQPFWPDVDWTTVDIYAPASGTVLTISPDGAWGKRLLLRPRDLPAMYVAIFHVNLDPGIVVNGWLEAGQHIGKHSSNNTSSDIAVQFGEFETGTLVSYFETMTDAVFQEYKDRGVSSRNAFIITKEERDADAIPCAGQGQFTVHGTLEDWVILD
jgi:hypothetical protein